MFFALPDAVLHAIQSLNHVGFEAYVVGGCVRDTLMGKVPEDWDITTSATPEEMQTVFADYRTIETGLKHGTLTVIVQDTQLEITTYRVDGDYSDGRHPDAVTFTSSLAEDLRRRDFTINAMAYHPEHGLVDPYGGQRDLSLGVLRCVGDPHQRFSEDALRILRALRFASVLKFSIDADTDAALRLLSPTLTCVAAERIAVELCKLLCGWDAKHIVSTYKDVLAVMLPELADVTDFSLLSRVPATLTVRLAALFYGTDSLTAEAVLRRLRMDTHTIDSVKRLLMCKGMPTENDADLLRLLQQLNVDLIFDYLAVSQVREVVYRRIRKLLEDNVCYHVSMLEVNGNDLIAAGVSPGPAIGKALNRLLDAVMDGKCSNAKETLLTYLKIMEKPVQ